jgi:hypothetical protein
MGHPIFVFLALPVISNTGKSYIEKRKYNWSVLRRFLIQTVKSSIDSEDDCLLISSSGKISDESKPKN